MTKMSNLAALLLAALSSTGMASQLKIGPLKASEVEKLFYGKTMTGEYADGQAWAEKFGTDGTSHYSQNGKVFIGKMSMKGDFICFQYAPDTGFSGGCFEVWKRSENCFDFYSINGSGQPSASYDQKRYGRAWDARAWYPQKKSTCTTDQIS